MKCRLDVILKDGGGIPLAFLHMLRPKQDSDKQTMAGKDKVVHRWLSRSRLDHCRRCCCRRLGHRYSYSRESNYQLPGDAHLSIEKVGTSQCELGLPLMDERGRSMAGLLALQCSMISTSTTFTVAR